MMQLYLKSFWRSVFLEFRFRRRIFRVLHRATTGYKYVVRCSSLSSFISSKYVYSWLIVCYYIFSNVRLSKQASTWLIARIHQTVLDGVTITHGETIITITTWLPWKLCGYHEVYSDSKTKKITVCDNSDNRMIL